MSKNLNKAVKTGVTWVMVERSGLQILNLLASVILARILVPSDFGVMALALLFTGASTRLARFGFGMALIRQETLRPDHVSTLFIMTLIINSALYLTLVTLSPYVGDYFDNALVGGVLAMLSLNFLIRCLGICPSALLRREMNFKATTIGVIIDCIIKIVVSITLALRGHGVWSLVYAELAGAFIGKVYLIYASGWRPNFWVTRRAFHELFSFGFGISLKSLFVYISDNADNFIVGKWLGMTALGFYDKAYNLMRLPARELGSRMNIVLFPAFAKIYKEPGRMKAAYRKTVLSLSLFAYPVFGTLIVLAPQIILILFGPQWTPAVVPFQILCVAGLPRIMAQITSSIINATGAVMQEVKQRAVTLVLLVVAASVGLRWGVVGIAWAVALVNLVTYGLIVSLFCRICRVRIMDALAPQGVPLAAALALMVVEKSVQEWTVNNLGLNAFGALAASLSMGVIAYITILYLLKNAALIDLYKELIGDLRPVLNRVAFSLARRGR